MKTKVKTDQQTNAQPKNGSDLFVELLVEKGVDTVFGYPGGAVLPIYDAIHRNDAPFRHILSRHEQGSIFAAEGYARVTGKPAVVLSTSGPGATNLVTGITDAMMDSLPIVIFTGQVGDNVIGTDAFQESDVLGITTPITKYNYQIKKLSELPRIVNEAFHIATSGRPGPVVIDIPKNISTGIVERKYEKDFYLQGYQPTTKPNPMQVKKLAEVIGRSERPVILAGAGVKFSNAYDELLALVEKTDIPVVNTLQGLGGFPGKHDLALGMGGMHGSYAANMAMSESDLLINIGARFDDRLTGNLEKFASDAMIAHIDIDPAEIGKNVPTAIPIVADAKKALQYLLKQTIHKPDHNAWLARIKENQRQFPLWYEKSDEACSPQSILEKICKKTEGKAIMTTDVGQHQMWAAQYYAMNDPHLWVTSGGLGAMGFGFPAAIGAQLGRPEETVISINGDGGIQMNIQEMMLLKVYNLPVKVFIFNNSALGMVRQWQEKFFDERYSESLLTENPDFVKLAESYGVKGMRAEKEEEIDQILEDALNHDGPVVVDFRIIKKEKVFPMVAPGKGINEMIGVTK